MGVPKFYRWVSERYPCLSQVVQEHQIPEFDNMYLDMNGIIHPCSHPNDDDPHFRITEEQIFSNIFHYIEVLFQIIKPKKVFFMAVDGVAPRAKMNQQRGRRFRSAREAEDNIRRALEKGQILPKEERFDSNCITPGTVFMARLQEQLQYFVSEKISNDPAWQGLRIYLSGQQTPGEGEHKIMEFIRTERTKPDYDPNTRHCLYGLDADLMMLGLTSHEPHFSLLREEVRFGKTSKRIEKPEKITFHLLHLSLFREYLDWEFSALKTTLTFPYDLDRIVDDWILMGFLVGNDFIPHLPYLHINHDALPLLYRVYKEAMPKLDGYLHDGGILNLPRFEKYLEKLSKFDREKFEETFVDMKWFEAKQQEGRSKGYKEKPKAVSTFTTDSGFSGLDSLAVEFEQFKLDSSDAAETLSPELAQLAAKTDGHEGDEETDVFEIEFAMHKNNYYRDKFEFQGVDSKVILTLTWEYVRGIQWILHYYFNGVQSWSWYYPYHYAPFLSDVKGFGDFQLTFNMSNPFLPFEQLLAVLPAASKQLLPGPLQNLMIMEQSPIIDYYPLNFKTDLNGKQQEWEAVVLIPFIDEKRLLEAMKPLYPRLTKDETKRNRHGPCRVYTFDKDLTCRYPSSLPGMFPDILCCHAKCKEFDRDELVTPPDKLIKGLYEGVQLDVYFPGFPTLHHIPHTAELKRANIKVFQMHSRSESMVLQLTPQPQKVTIRVAEQLLGETCYVGWPHMVEALVVGVTDNTFRYTLKRGESSKKEIKQVVITEEDGWDKQVNSFTQTQLERRGVEVGPTDVLVEACPIVGRRFLCSAKGQVTLEKEWSPLPKQYALQAVVKDIHVHESVTENSVRTIEELFPIGAPCFMLAMPHYGACGEVLEIDVKQGRVRVQLKVPEEPDMASIAQKRQVLSVDYLQSHLVAQKLGISSLLLGKITAKFLIERGSKEKSKGQGKDKIDIGLNMKLTKQNKELLGYTRRTLEYGWLFSPTALKVIAEYLQKFPHLFEALAVIPQCDQYFESDFTDQNLDADVLSDVTRWLKSLPLTKQELVACGSESLDDPVLEDIEKAVTKAKETTSFKSVKVRVRPYLLFRPSDYLGHILPDTDVEFQLLDRVVNVKMNSTVPFGLRGTVTGFHEELDEDEVLEVMFDESFSGNQPIRRSSNNMSLVHPSSVINLTYGERQEARKRGSVATPPRPLKQSFAAALLESSGSRRKGKDRSPQRDPTRKTGSPRTPRHLTQASPDVKFDSPGPGIIRIMTANGVANGPMSDRHGSPATTRQVTTPKGQTRVPSTVQSGDKGKEWTKKQEKPPRFVKAKNADNSSEFASMWKELQSKENSPPDTGKPVAPYGKNGNITSTNQPKSPDEKDDSEGFDIVKKLNPEFSEADGKDKSRSKSPSTVAKEGTQALCALLRVGRNSSPVSSESSPREKHQQETVPRQGRVLSLDELFSSQRTTPKESRIPASPTPLNQSALPSQLLMDWCTSVGLPPPLFHYVPHEKGVVAMVELANGFKFSGSPCKDRIEASHSASAVALSQMPRILPPQFASPPPVPLMHPLMGQMPYPSHSPSIPLHGRPVRPMFGYHHMRQFPPQPRPHSHHVQHVMELQQQELNQRAMQMGPRQPKAGLESAQMSREADRGKERAKDVPLDPKSNPFIPLQVTRRNLTPKSAPSSKPPTETDGIINQKLEDKPVGRTSTKNLMEAGKGPYIGADQSPPTDGSRESETINKERSEQLVESEDSLSVARGKQEQDGSKSFPAPLENISQSNQNHEQSNKSIDNETIATPHIVAQKEHNTTPEGPTTSPQPTQVKSARRPPSAARRAQKTSLLAPNFFKKKES